MKYVLLAIAAILFFSSCSVPSRIILQETESISAAKPQLKNIIISAFGTVRFSGLIGLVERDNGLQYILLDATGIKLLEAVIAKDGSYEIIHGIQKLKQGELPQLLATSLHRIYYIQPLQSPCSSYFLSRLCRKTLDDGNPIKYFLIGPFPAWKVVYKNDAKENITYEQPWLGLNIHLSQAQN